LKTISAGATQTVQSCSVLGLGNCWVQGPGGLTSTTCGNVGIGTAAPAQALDIGGGNIKMGYEAIQIIAEFFQPPSDRL